ncbi:MAG TPA: DUF4112 domain-containing protein [Thermoanaerobaculia bacterium]|nr:DUF4112 domain-containing protein [Thermoanaerobaculia bacterium]
MPDSKLHIPDVIEPESKLPPDLIALRKFARLMDEAFPLPGTNIRVGLDAVIGLIPGIGDVVGGILSTWIIVGALRHRVPARIIARMVLNICIDLLFGAVPVAGDVFDFLFEENMKNMRLLELHRDRRRPPRSTAQIAFVATLILAFVIMVALLLVAGVVALVLWLIAQRARI